MPAGIFDNSSGTIWNHDNGYSIPSATENANENNLGQNILDPTGLVSGFWNDIMGFSSQSREFSQQEYLQDKMNEYNLPANQMARMKAAGINPATAAGTIANGGNESAQAPSVASNTSGPSSGLSAIGSAVGGVASMALNAAQRRNLDASSQQMLAEAREVAPNAEANRSLLNANVYKTFCDARFTNAESIGLEMENLFRGESLQLDLAAKRLQLPLLRSQIRVHNSEFNKNISDARLALQKIKESKQTMSLMEYEKAVKIAEANKAALEADDIKWHLDFKLQNGYDPQWPSHSILWAVAADPNYTDDEAAAKYDFMLDKLFELRLKEASASGLVQMTVNTNRILDEYYKEHGLNAEQVENDIRRSWGSRPGFSLGRFAK